MIDIRYHIYSLAAVFLALALGIVIGASFVKPSTETNRTTIRRYEQMMRDLRTEITQSNSDLSDRETALKDWQDFCKAMMPAAIKDKLLWRNVAVIRTGDYGELSGAVKQALEMAGAPVTNITDLSRSFKFDNNDKVAQVLTSCGLAPGDDSVDSRDKLFNIITNGACSGKFSNAVSRLEGAGIGTFTGDYARQSKMVVLIGGSTDDSANTAETVDAKIIARLLKQGVHVVACEPTMTGSSYVGAWQKMGISTIDNVDSPMGQISLVYALAGEKGNFGLKDTADRLIPKTLGTEAE